MLLNRSARAASALVLSVAAALGPAGCANQPVDPYGMAPPPDATLPPVQVDPQLDSLPTAAQLAGLPPDGGAAQPPAASPVPAAAPVAQGPAAGLWPREAALADGTALIYQPQVDGWVGNRLDFRLAAAVKTGNAKQETFGVVRVSARTEVDRTNRTVALEDLKLTEVRFPTLPDNGLALMRQLRTSLPAALAQMPLDLLEGALAASGTVKPGTVQVRNTPPRVIVSNTPAILVPIDGKPVARKVPGSRFERVINTQALIARAGSSGLWYLHVFDGWLSASTLDGSWTKALPPAGLDALAGSLAKAGTVDLLDGGPKAQPRPTLANGVPTIYVSEVPAELIVFKGQPDFVPVTGTALLWARNTTADVIVDTSSNDYFLLMSGRWYRGPGLNGPWSHVASTALPADFRKIPKDAPAGIVLASVAGTPQAQEALIANSVPQTASVPLANGPTFTPVFDGAPRYRPVEGTPLRYVANAQAPLIEVGPNSYFAVQAGVWFVAPAVTGPWSVATSVPEVIYTIPASSPLHYVTYVRVYGASDQVAYVGYTPGYLGTVVAPDGIVVYGTGYDYAPWIGSAWYGAPVTWGLAAAPIYNPYVGYAYGFGLGLATAAWAVPYWGGAYYHPGYWGYPCCGSTSASVYGHWGNAVYSGTRSWYANDGRVGTTATGAYTNLRTGTTGNYAAGRSYDPYTGQAQRGYDRTFDTAGGTTGNVARGSTYNVDTGQRSYASSASATGPGGSSVSRTAGATAGPEGVGAQHTTSAYDARTGQTRSYTSSGLFGDHYAGADGNVYRNDGGGWQQHGAGGWGAASGDTSWADREQQFRSSAESRSGGYGGGDWGGDRFGGGGWGDRFGGGSYGGRFGGGGFGGGFRGGGFRR
jgi:hypothetical protein